MTVGFREDLEHAAPGVRAKLQVTQVAFSRDPGVAHHAGQLIGAAFGDQCSPISDTTILSSMFTGCDLMDHVRTQLPLAFVSASLGVAASTLAVLLLVD